VTVLTSESRLVGTSVASLPRVNLLPPEIAERAAFRKVQMGLGCAVLAAVAVVGLLYASASSSVSSAQQSLDAESAKTTSLQAESAKYRDVTATYAAAAAAQAQLTTALGDEVRYSQLLNDLSLSVPSTVWLKSLSFASGAPATAGAAAASTGAPATIGTLTVSGVGFSHDDLAVWLESVANLKTYANPYFSSSSEVLLGSRKVVNFSSTANVTPAALSGRYTKPAGG
jgi:Tfp pilus assembly protein PilN